MKVIDQKSIEYRQNRADLRSAANMSQKGEETRNTVKIERRDLKKTRMLRRAAHDLRNPISGILSASEFLLEDLPNAHEEHVALLRAIQSASRLILRLIDDVTVFPTAKSEILQLFVEPTDIVSLVKQDLVLNRPVAERKRVHLDLTTEDQTPTMLIDPSKIYQVIDKLVTNAIRVSYPDSQIEINVGVNGDAATLRVRDHGPGIPKREQKTILDTQRRRKTPKSRAQEARPGLAIVTRIVRGHGGDIQLESEPGKGATFSVSLPLRSSGLRRTA